MFWGQKYSKGMPIVGIPLLKIINGRDEVTARGTLRVWRVLLRVDNP